MASEKITVEDIIKKAQLVKKRFQEMQHNISKLEIELANAQKFLKEQEEINFTLGEEIKMFKLAHRLTETSAEEKGELKQKINEIIRSVDLCIAQLSEENGN